MRTTRLLAAVLALTLTTGGVLPCGKTTINSNVAIINAEENEFYAHNYRDDEIKFNTDSLNYAEISEVAYQKDISKLSEEDRKKLDNKICIFSVIHIQEGSNNSKSIHCQDYFIDKSEYDPDEVYNLYFSDYTSNGSKNGFYIFSEGHTNVNPFIEVHSYIDIDGKTIPPSVSKDNVIAAINVNREVVNLKNKYILYGANNIEIDKKGDVEHMGNAPVGKYSPDGTITLLNDIYKLGDVNGDDLIDMEDVAIITNHINGVKALEGKFFKAADVNLDGYVDIEDVNIITNHINGVTPIEEKEKYHKFDASADVKTTTTTAITTITTTTTTNAIFTTITTTAPIAEPTKYSLGDIDGDGRITAKDASAVLGYYAAMSVADPDVKSELNEEQVAVADVNKSGVVNAVDASIILSYYAYTSSTHENVMTFNEFLKERYNVK